VASQDLGSVSGIQISPISFQQDFNRFINKYNFRIKRLLEEQDELYSTSKDVEKSRDLLANFIKTGFLDIVCMMVDNHLGNKNTLKRYGAKGAEDIISFDLEDSGIDWFNNSTYSDFKREINNAEDMFSGVISIDGRDRTYMDYLNRMRELRDSGKLPPECHELFDNILKLDFDGLLASTERETGLIVPTYKKDILRKLIDVSQETFSR